MDSNTLPFVDIFPPETQALVQKIRNITQRKDHDWLYESLYVFYTEQFIDLVELYKIDPTINLHLKIPKEEMKMLDLLSKLPGFTENNS